MRILGTFVFVVCALGQTVKGPTVDVAKALADQMAPKPADPERVVAVVDGMKVTAGELFQLYSSLNSSTQFYLAQNRKELLLQYVTAKKMIRVALEAKLDEREPYKRQLQMSRESILAQALLDQFAAKADYSEEARKKFYNENKDGFTFGVTRGIAIFGVGDDRGKRAGEILKRLRAGEDFAKVAQEMSSDRRTAEKGGEIGLVAKSGPYPEIFRKTLFALKPGEISEPFESNGAYWILRLEGIEIKPFEQSREDIDERIRQETVGQALAKLREALDIKIEDPEYFKVEMPTGFMVGNQKFNISTKPNP